MTTHENMAKEGKDSGEPKIAERLFEARTILIHGEINSKVAERVSGLLLAMSAASNDAIDCYVHSQGGHVESGDTIHDMIRYAGPTIRMIGTGWVASAGAHIYLAAEKENRFCLPNTRFLLHQPWGGVGGQATDIGIEAKEIIKMKQRLIDVIARQTGQPVERVTEDTQRNFWMSATEAVEYGLVGKIVSSIKEIR